jgi:hypothetical protein
MTCDEARDLILDGTANTELADHLRDCPACGATASDHARASALRLDPAPLLRPLDVAEVVRRARARRAVRLAAVAAGGLAVVLAAHGLSTRRNAPPDVAGIDMTQLLAEVDGYTHADVSVADPAYAPFGPMASWFALPDLDNCTAAQPRSIACFTPSTEEVLE